MATSINRWQRQATPARWRKAVERALAENVQVRQLAGSGAWIATSGTDATTAYEVEVTGDVAHGCNCLAGLNGDLVCKHRAAFYLAVGLLDPEPEPPGFGAGRVRAVQGRRLRHDAGERRLWCLRCPADVPGLPRCRLHGGDGKSRGLAFTPR